MIDRQPTAAPATRVIVIGASAGGLEPLRIVVADLPADLQASVLVVVHVSATGTSVLPQILERASALHVAAARDGLELAPGQLVVAPPGHHLVVAGTHVELVLGARDNGHRPAIDPLFRTAAAAYGPACCAVVLSGTRNDGAAGVSEVKRHGGTVLVQDPDEALFADMPANAIGATTVDAVLPAAEIGAALVALTLAHPDPQEEATR